MSHSTAAQNPEQIFVRVSMTVHGSGGVRRVTHSVAERVNGITREMRRIRQGAERDTPPGVCLGRLGATRSVCCRSYKIIRDAPKKVAISTGTKFFSVSVNVCKIRCVRIS